MTDMDDSQALQVRYFEDDKHDVRAMLLQLKDYDGFGGGMVWDVEILSFADTPDMDDADRDIARILQSQQAVGVMCTWYWPKAEPLKNPPERWPWSRLGRPSISVTN